MFFMIFSCNYLHIVRRFFIFVKNEGFILTADKVFSLYIVQPALRLRRAYSNSLNFYQTFPKRFRHDRKYRSFSISYLCEAGLYYL